MLEKDEFNDPMAGSRVASVSHSCPGQAPPRRRCGKGVRLESGRRGFESCFRHGSFLPVESYQGLQNWYSRGYSARLYRVSAGTRYWSDWCQYALTGWDGKLDLPLLSQCGIYLNAWADCSLRYAITFLGRKASNQTTKQPGLALEGRTS